MSGPIPTTADSTARRARYRRYARRAVRAALLLTAALLLVLDGTRLSVFVSGSSPLVAIASLLATKVFQATTWIGLCVAVIALVRRRWFCRWVCPTGTCADGAVFVGNRLNRRCVPLPPVGQWIALLTLGGAVLGYPILLWLDPLALFSGPFGLLDIQPTSGTVWNAMGLLAILALTLFWPGAWCARACPLGGLQELLHHMGRTVRATLARSRAKPREPAAGLPRRVVLGAAVGVVWAAAVKHVRATASRPLRPPGAVDEDRFAGLCIRCGNCVRACSVDIIDSDQGEHGIAALLTPTLDFRHDYCREDCVACTLVCPSGALTELALQEKKNVRIGRPRVDMQRCLLGDDRECSLCRNGCPYEAITRVFSEVEYTLTPTIDRSRCNGCGACELACPTTPTKAIVVVPRENP